MIAKGQHVGPAGTPHVGRFKGAKAKKHETSGMSFRRGEMLAVGELVFFFKGEKTEVAPAPREATIDPGKVYGIWR